MTQTAEVKDTRNMALIVLIPQTILWPITPNGVPIFFKYTSSTLMLSPVDNLDETVQKLGGKVTLTVDRTNENAFSIKIPERLGNQNLQTAVQVTQSECRREQYQHPLLL